jgi:hypothetical protein
MSVGLSDTVMANFDRVGWTGWVTRPNRMGDRSG